MTGAVSSEARSDQLEALLRRTARKDEAAFERLYSSTKPKLFSTVLLIVRRRHLAEEVLQEVYVRIWVKAAQYDPSLGSPMSWMGVIARNLAIDMARKTIRESNWDDSVLYGFPIEEPTTYQPDETLKDQANAFNQRLNITCAMQGLNLKQRQLILAAYIGGDSRKQLSERYGVPVNTIKTWIRRALLVARTTLQNEVAEQHLTDCCDKSHA
jgi:RNA polymerase sigma-70 factor (ECF subfamily)